MTFHLVLSIFWTFLGLLLLVFDADFVRPYLRDNRQLAGGLALVLGIYNLVRWWSVRSEWSRQERAQAALRLQDQIRQGRSPADVPTRQSATPENNGPPSA